MDAEQVGLSMLSRLNILIRLAVIRTGYPGNYRFMSLRNRVPIAMDNMAESCRPA